MAFVTQQASPIPIASGNQAQLLGMVDSIVFSNQETGYAVMRLVVDEEWRDRISDQLMNRKHQVTVFGNNMAHVPAGEKLCVTGKIARHKEYGYQIDVSEFTLAQPRTLAEYEKFLVGHVKQINKHYAREIVAKFGFQTLDIIANTPERLLEVPGIGEKRLEEIKKCWREQSYERDLLMFFTQVGLPVRFKEDIKKEFGNHSIARIKEDPYVLCRLIRGIGFKTADEVARHMGLSESSPSRLRAAALHLIDESQMEGHCFQYQQEMVPKVVQFLDQELITTETVTAAIEEAVAMKMVIREENRLYSPQMLNAENKAAAGISLLLSSPLPPNLEGARFNIAIDAALKAAQVPLDDTQKEAIRRSLSSKVSYITGGPGTGKSTITRCVVAGFKSVGLQVTLLAPTGRASKRLSEVVGLPACTIHKRLVELKIEGGTMEGAIIGDEYSMVDINLLAAKLQRMQPDQVLVIVGDTDQLPSVGPGAVLRDLIACGRIPGTRLTTIHRQAAGSDIIVNAHAINRGSMPNINRLSRSNGVPLNTDMMTCLIDDAQEQLNAVLWLSTTFARQYGFDPIRDTQIISPGHNGVSGVANLNIALQQKLNPTPLDSFRRKEGVMWGLGDRLMNTKNSYPLGVFNGDLGTLVAINRVNGSVEEIEIDFDGRLVKIPHSHFSSIQMAYATTVHKCQGSEYPFVIVVLHTSHFMLLQRNLLYTAVTRSRKMCVLVANTQALSTALRTETTSRRNTFLAEKIAWNMRGAA